MSFITNKYGIKQLNLKELVGGSCNFSIEPSAMPDHHRRLLLYQRLKLEKPGSAVV